MEEKIKIISLNENEPKETLYQYDKGQIIEFKEEIADETHVLISNAKSKKADRKVIMNNRVEVLDELLEESGTLVINIQIVDESSETTTKTIRMRVLPRKDAYEGPEKENQQTFIEQIQGIMNSTKSIAEDVQERADNGEFNGEKGEKGDKGDKGDVGYSPTAKVERIENGAKITITDKNGTTEAIVNDGEGGGSSGANNYDDLNNKPQINSVELSGNKSLNDLGIASQDDIKIEERNEGTIAMGVWVPIGENVELHIRKIGGLYMYIDFYDRDNGFISNRTITDGTTQIFVTPPGTAKFRCTQGQKAYYSFVEGNITAQQAYDRLNDNKVNKENGKSLISDTEIERLATVDNYDDTEIKTLIEEKQDSPVEQGTSGQVLGLDDELKPIWKNVENSSAEKEWTIVETLLTEDIATFVQSFPTGIKEMKFIILGALNDANYSLTSGYAYMFVRLYNENNTMYNVSYPYLYIRQQGITFPFNYEISLLSSEYSISERTLESVNGWSGSGKPEVHYNMPDVPNSFQGSKITKLEIVPATSSHLFKAGSKIVVFYR